MSTGETSGGGGGTSTWDWDTGTTHPGTTASHARISLAEKTAAVTKYTALVTRQPGTRRCHATIEEGFASESSYEIGNQFCIHI